MIEDLGDAVNESLKAMNTGKAKKTNINNKLLLLLMKTYQNLNFVFLAGFKSMLALMISIMKIIQPGRFTNNGRMISLLQTLTWFQKPLMVLHTRSES